MLGLHALVLGWLPPGVGDGWLGGVKPMRPVTTVRLGPVADAGGTGKAPPTQHTAAQATATTTAEPTPTQEARSTLAQPNTAASAASAPAFAPVPPASAAVVLTDAAAAAASDASQAIPDSGPATAPEAEDGGQPPPVYATRPPPPVRLQFDLRRGPLRGDAEFSWSLSGQSPGQYQLSMTGQAFGVTVLNWLSTGGFDGAGLAPERFLDRRRSRDQRAANFQRAAGKITFSGPPIELPLVPGAQDRLSWLVQLAAIVNAAPGSFPPGARISLFVVGARGDGDLWHFSVEAREDIRLPMGAVQGALRLKREPRRPYDTGGEVWLDPARHHLPVRVRLFVNQTDENTEFLLRAFTPP